MDTLRNKNRAPSHLGSLLRDVVLPERLMTQGEFVDRMCENAFRKTEPHEELLRDSTELKLTGNLFCGTTSIFLGICT